MKILLRIPDKAEDKLIGNLRQKLEGFQIEEIEVKKTHATTLRLFFDTKRMEILIPCGINQPDEIFKIMEILLKINSLLNPLKIRSFSIIFSDVIYLIIENWGIEYPYYFNFSFRPICFKSREEVWIRELFYLKMYLMRIYLTLKTLKHEIEHTINEIKRYVLLAIPENKDVVHFKMAIDSFGFKKETDCVVKYENGWGLTFSFRIKGITLTNFKHVLQLALEKKVKVVK